MYSVFVVEDEIVTREGIRNNIPWDNTEFTLVGEAPDGEMALHAIREIKPDILITDIKMPFMDGLALSRLVKEDQPWIKIIILSGHDEFHYAKEAISIGVEEYLLKPVSSGDMLSSLEKVATRLEEERSQRCQMENLERKVRTHREILREKWGFDLIMGRMESREALERGKELDLDVSAPGFTALVIGCNAPGGEEAPGGRVSSLLAGLIPHRRDIFLTLPNRNEYILLVKIDNPSLADDRLYALAQGIKHEAERTGEVALSIGIGSVASHLEELRTSYVEAGGLIRYMSRSGESKIMGTGDIRDTSVLWADHSAGGQSLMHLEQKHNEQIVLAKKYIERNFMSPDISLNAVASHVNVSPNHFSTVFSQEEGRTFIEYLTGVRLERARELLVSSSMKCGDVAYEVGYGDPHYFSFIFKKNTGLSPREYRSSHRPAGRMGGNS